MDDEVKREALQIIGAFQILPQLVVFDLDYTLWPFYCEMRSKREVPQLYAHAKGILNALNEKRINVAIASRSPSRDIAQAFIQKLNIQTVAQEIFSSYTHKTEHFQKIQAKTGVPYSSMLFFDDENRNIISVSKMCVTSVLVDDGINLDNFRQGLTEFAQNVEYIEKNKQRWKNFSNGSKSSSANESD